MAKNFLVEAEANDAGIEGKIDALRCDTVKSSLFAERKRIACEILKMIRKHPDLDDANEEELSDLCVEAMFYFGDDVFGALRALEENKDSSREEKLANLQIAFLAYFDLRTLK